MFRLLLPTIIREPLGSTKVTCVFYIYSENGMVTACRFMYPMFLADLADPDRQGEDRV